MSTQPAPAAPQGNPPTAPLYQRLLPQEYVRRLNQAGAINTPQPCPYVRADLILPNPDAYRYRQIATADDLAPRLQKHREDRALLAQLAKDIEYLKQQPEPPPNKGPYLPPNRPLTKEQRLQRDRKIFIRHNHRLNDEFPRLMVQQQDSPIHPCLRQDQFTVENQAMSDADFGLLLPSLRLVSCLLDDLSVLSYFNGLLKRPRAEKPATGGVAKFCDTVFAFEDVMPRSHDECMTVWRNVVAMRSEVEFKFNHKEHLQHNGRDVDNCPGLFKPMLRPDAFNKSKIYLHADFLKVLRGEIKASTILTPEELGEPLDQVSAMLRTHLCLSLAIFHELGHAFNYFYFTSQQDSSYIREPYFRDERIAEIGHSINQHVVGGSVWSIAGHQIAPGCDCAYGLKVDVFPTRSAPAEKLLRDLTPAEMQLRPWITVTMEHVIKFFTPEFWTEAVPLYGPRILKVHGVDATVVPDPLAYEFPDLLRNVPEGGVFGPYGAGVDVPGLSRKREMPLPENVATEEDFEMLLDPQLRG